MDHYTVALFSFKKDKILIYWIEKFGGGTDSRTEEGGLKSRLGEPVSGSFEVNLSQRSHPVISLGWGPGVAPVVICYTLKC